MTTALVTGGAGFVGRHLVKRLLTLGHEVWVVDNLFAGKHPSEWIVPDKITFIKRDVRDFFNWTGGPHFDYVFHLAAVVGGRVNIEKEPIAVARDIAIDSDFFNWVVEVRPGKTLYASSSAAYPIDLQREGTAVCLKEDYIQFGGRLGQPDMTYGFAKLTGEYLATLAAKRYGVSIACVRPFSGYGEDQDETYPVPAIARRAANREDPLHIWGSGTQGRDFVYIEDCIDMMLIAIEKISDGSAVNIGSGKLTTFFEVAEIFAKIAGYSPKIETLKDKPMGVHSRFADISRARSMGWKPRISIEEGFGKVFEAKYAK
jgi:nucleoside-diphosphate-sugar epimerase